MSDFNLDEFLQELCESNQPGYVIYIRHHPPCPYDGRSCFFDGDCIISLREGEGYVVCERYPVNKDNIMEVS